MTLTDGAEAVDDNNRELDWVATDQEAADQSQAMDLDERRASIPVLELADNACGASGPSEERKKNLRAASVVQGMDIEPSDIGENNNTEVIAIGVDEDYSHFKAEVSSAENTIKDPESPTVNESSPDRPLSRPRRSDASRPGRRKLNTAKTRSSSLTSQRSARLQDGVTPESKDVRGGSRKRGEDGDELMHTSSSEEGDELDGTGYRCGICNEDFESAKSLSLHKKYHPQYTLRRNPKRSRKLIDQEYAVEAGVVAAPVQASAPTKKTSSMSEEVRPCTECGKEFPSWKALFGHMRCHPEREWRGIQPPSEKSNGPGSGPHTNHASSRRKKLASQLPPPAPLVTEENEKSGSLDSRRAARVTGKASDNESDTESIEATYMSNGDRHAVMGWKKRSKRSRQTHRTLEAVNNAKADKKELIEALMLLQSSKDGMTVVHVPDAQGRLSRSKSHTPESELEAEEANDELPHRDRKVKRETEVASPCEDTEDGGDDFDAGDQGTSARSKYECATCKRQFKSHQALGGHRASHKKVKGCFARTNVSDGGAREQSQESMEPEEEEMLKSEEQLPNELQETSHNSEELDTKPCYLATAREDNEEMVNSTTRKSKAHECTICHRVFNSGQALGGHKRCHWGGGSGTPGCSTEVTSTSKPVQTGQQSRPSKEVVQLQLDLNLPAPECQEEEMPANNTYLPPPPAAAPPAPPAAGIGLSFFKIISNNNSSQNSYGDSPAEQGQQGESEPAANNQVESSINNQFSTFEHTYHPTIDTITIHQKPHVASMALVPGLTPTSA